MSSDGFQELRAVLAGPGRGPSVCHSVRCGMLSSQPAPAH